MSLPKPCTCQTVPQADCPHHGRDAKGSFAAPPLLGESVASLLKSAEAWAAEGLRESKLAGDAVRNQNHCTAENHRKNAALAFECELNLRKLTISPNDQALPHGGAERTPNAK